jgi:hypothetical protein
MFVANFTVCAEILRHCALARHTIGPTLFQTTTIPLSVEPYKELAALGKRSLCIQRADHLLATHVAAIAS